MLPIRPDRFATLYFFHPLRRMLGGAPAGIPILMYHSISCDREVERNPYFRTCTDPLVFSEQIRFLAQNGYRSIGMAELGDRLRREATPTNGKLVALTFDDGFRDFYTMAFPILNRFGYFATVYLPTAYIGVESLSFQGKPCLNWSQVRELRKAGVEFGSHTRTHPELRALPGALIHEELRESKHEIENRLGESIGSFSYPYAFPETDRGFQQEFRGMLVDCGYQTGVSTIIGTPRPSSDRFFLERIPVNSDDASRLFQAKLEGGYDWLHPVQLASKRLRVSIA